MAVNVRVELRPSRSNHPADRERANKLLFQEFKRRVNDAGIPHAIKEREFYESKGAKRRKERRAAILRYQQERILTAIERGESPKGAGKFLKRKKKKKNNKQRLD